MSGIGDLVANLTINSAPWRAGLVVARGQLGAFAGYASAQMGSLAGLVGGVFGAKVSIDAFTEALTATRELNAVMQSTGGVVGLTTQEIVEYANELERLTDFSAEATMGSAALLAGLGNVRGENLQRALSLSQDLATVFDTDMTGATKKLSKDLQGLSPEEVSAKLDEMAKKFCGAAQAAANPLVHLNNRIGDISEAMGAALLPAVTIASNALGDLIDTTLGGGDAFLQFGIEAAVQLSSIGQYFVLAATQGQLFALQLAGSIGHFFTTTVPSYLGWFGDNWQNLFTDIAANTLTIFENIGANIMSAMAAIWDYIASGGTKSLELAWQPLTKGFIKTVDDLPDIPDRVVSDFEKSLAQSITDQGDLIAESQAEMRQKLTEQFDPLKAQPAPINPDLFPDSGKDEKKKTERFADNTAAFAGSQQAAQIMLRGLTGPRNEELKEAKKQTQIQEETRDGILKIASRPDMESTD